MIAGLGWQDLIAALATLLAGAWLYRRWRAKKRAKAGCDHCAAAFVSAQARRTEARAPEAPRR